MHNSLLLRMLRLSFELGYYTAPLVTSDKTYDLFHFSVESANENPHLFFIYYYPNHLSDKVGSGQLDIQRLHIIIIDRIS